MILNSSGHWLHEAILGFESKELALIRAMNSASYEGDSVVYIETVEEREVSGKCSLNVEKTASNLDYEFFSI